MVEQSLLGVWWHSLIVTKDRPRGVVKGPFSPDRRLVAAALRAGRQTMPMHGLLDVDVTVANRLIAGHQPRLSFTAFVVASVARAAAEYPEVHAYRDWRGRLVTHRHVDVTTIVEVDSAEGPFPMPHVIRDADIRDVADLTAELRRVKADPSSSGGRDWLASAIPIGARIPGLFPTMYAVLRRSPRLRQHTGTVAVTAVGMFAGGGGFAIAPLTLMSLQIVIGGVSARPRVVGDQLTVRDVLDLTITVDHAIVDGAPAARFGARLRELVETATALSDL
jgi:pyruvate/2-oxoglutarate dehydrogenase complex dihydrolipoamide acyltransferase (E2) component